MISGAGEARQVEQIGQLVRLIVEGRVGREALLAQPGAPPQPLDEVAGLRELFDDPTLVQFLGAHLRAPSAARARAWSTGSAAVGVAIIVALLAASYVAGHRPTPLRAAPAAPPAIAGVTE